MVVSATERWRALQRARLLACDHDHVLVTVPHDLHPLGLANVSVMPTLLFQAVRDTLGTLLAAPTDRGAQPGILAALHTWRPTLLLHPHGPCFVTGGGLTPEGAWQAVRHGCLLPVRVVMAVLRGKRLAAMRQGVARETLGLHAGVRLPPFLTLLNRLGHPRTTQWNVPIRERYAHGVGVVTSRARDLRGGPLTNARLVADDGHRVTCTWRPRAEEAPVAVTKASGPSHLASTRRGSRWRPSSPPTAHLDGGRLSPALAAACPAAPAPGGPVLRAVPADAGGGPDGLPYAPRPTTSRGARRPGLAGRVCAARRPAPGVLPHLRTARGLHGHHPTRGRATSVRAVRSMRIPPSGQPV
ncbi:MAG: transposase, partial [Candidatus Tectomicrobia bacterium]|nr:transposase [Candidatus Tectomicrobia bacterium]